MNKFVHIIFVLLSSSALYSENTYPISYKLETVEDGGKLIVNFQNNTFYNYLIKPSWSGEQEVISYWKGNYKSGTKGSSLGNINILDSYVYENNLFLIYEENAKYYISVLDSVLNTIAVTDLYIGSNSYNSELIHWIALGHGKLALLLNNDLFIVDFIDRFLHRKSISSDVLAIAKCKLKNNSEGELIFLKKYDNLISLNLLDNGFKENRIAVLQLMTDVYLQTSNNLIYIISGNKLLDYSLIHFYTKDKEILNNFSVKSHPYLIKSYTKGNKNYMDYLIFENPNYSFVRRNVSINKRDIVNEVVLPEGLIEAKEIYNLNDTVYILFRNGLVAISEEGEILSKNFFPFGEYFDDIPTLFKIEDKLYFSSSSVYLIFQKYNNTFWLINKTLDEGGKYFFLIILIIILLILYRKYSVQKNLANALLDLPSSGVVFIIDNNGRLRRLNESGKKMLGITDDVPLRRIFKYYCDAERNQQLLQLVDKVNTLRSGFTQKIKIFDNNTAKEWYITVFPLRNVLGKSKGYVITGVDITEELERRRINNLAQLAHDMQTNLSTIRLNAEQLECDEDTNNVMRRKKIIHQVTLLIQRVRDIVTVGRSDNPDWHLIDASDICIEVRNEFDESMFPNISFNLEVKSFQIKCDKQKLIRAIRNAVENGIRAIGNKKGEIFISNWYDTRFSYFSIKDTGTGMDEERKKKMMTPYFSTSNKEGGAGIGTLIMQSVIEQHAGELKVFSEPNKGTEVVFCIPNPERGR